MDEKTDKLIDLLESSNGFTAEELKICTSDSENLQTSKDFLECKNAVLQEFSRNTPNVEREWEKFKEKTHRRSGKRLFSIGSITGIAASLLFILMFNFLKQSYQNTQGVTVYKATNTAQQIVLQTSEGKELVLTDENMQQAISGTNANITNLSGSSITYAQSSKTETHTITTPRGMDFKVVLADGTSVWLNAESKLEYPSQFSGNERRVKLQGEAYFEVAKNKNKPFIVEANGVKTRVLGTQFNVRAYSKADSHVTLIEGSVEVANSTSKVFTRIKPGESAHLQNDGSFELSEVDIDSYVYWKEGFFYFDNVALSEIMQDLGRWYNVNIIFTNKDAMKYKMHYLCDRKGGLEHALELLNRMKKVEVSLEGNSVFVR